MIYLASDHAGFELKEKIEEFLKSKNYEIEDIGPHKFNPNDDYPDFVYPCAKRVSQEKGSFGIVIGGDGQGEVIVANRVKGVRAVVFYGPATPKNNTDIKGTKSNDPYEVLKLTRQHNDANVLSLGARFLTEEEAKKAVGVWLSANFTNEERHVRRIGKIKDLEE